MKNHDKKRLTRAQKISLSNGRRKAPEVSLPPMRDFGERAESGYFGRSPLVDVDLAKLEQHFPEARDD